ncbi:MAG: coiled-coil domain-containing protein [Planctomycetota bacterium]|jgi:chromosome segregation ATPase
MARNNDEAEVFKEIATRKIEKERLRALRLEEENDKLRKMAADLQRKISVASARAADFERKLKSQGSAADKKLKEEIKTLESHSKSDLSDERAAFKNEIEDLKQRHEIQLQRERDKLEIKIAKLEAQHEKDVSKEQARRDRDLNKLDGTVEQTQNKLDDLADALKAEKDAKQEAEARLRKLDSTARRIGVRSGQVTGFEVDTPEELLSVLGDVQADKPLKLLRAATRNLKTAAREIERVFARALKDPAAKAELHDAGAAFAAAREVPNTDELPPAPAMLVEEFFTTIGDEVAERIKGRHYYAIIGAVANELARVLRNQRQDLSKLKDLVEIADGTDIAQATRQLLKGATSHQQEVSAAKLLADELRSSKAAAREEQGKVKKLYAVAESGMAGEWAADAIQAIASLQPMPRVDKDALRLATYKRVVESAKLVHQRIDSSVNLGAEAEAALRNADECFAGLEGLAQKSNELLQAARSELMSKVEGEQAVRNRIESERERLAELGNRGQRAASISDENLRGLDMLLTQWKATYQAYRDLTKDLDRIEASIDGQMLDITQPLHSEQGRKLYQIIHDLSEHLPEFRSLSVTKQRMFFHLENPKQRPSELSAVREATGKIIRALEDPLATDHITNYQLSMARLYEIWAYLEEVRGGTHSQMAVAGESVEPILSEVYTWLSTNNVSHLTDMEQDELFFTCAYVKRLKKAILGIHDQGNKAGGSETNLTAQFESKLDHTNFPEEWTHVVARIPTGTDPDLNSPESAEQT